MDILHERMRSSPLDNIVESVDNIKYPDVHKYMRYYDEAINHGLRTGKLGRISYRIIKDIFKALNDAPVIEEEVVLFRGVESTTSFPVKDFKVGQIITDPGFASKTSVGSTAYTFAGTSCCILIIRYPPGSKHIRLYYPLLTDEHEYITYPGETFVVVERSYGILVLDYIGNVYVDIQSMLDDNVDKDYYSFLRAIDPFFDDYLYFEDVDKLYAGRTPFPIEEADAFFTPNVYDIEGRFYSYATTGKAKNVYVLLDMDKVTTLEQYELYKKGELPNFRRIKIR